MTVDVDKYPELAGEFKVGRGEHSEAQTARRSERRASAGAGERL